MIQFSAPIPDADLLSEIQSARRSAKATAGKRPQAKPSTRYVDWGGGEHDLPGLGVGDRLAGVLGGAIPLDRPVRNADAPKDHRKTGKTKDGAHDWLCSETVWKVGPGDITGLPTGALVAGDRALGLINGDHVPPSLASRLAPLRCSRRRW